MFFECIFIQILFSPIFGSLLVQPKLLPPLRSNNIDLHATISQLESNIPNYCNNSKLIEQSGLIRAPMGQFLGFPCSNEFYHCRWQSDGYRTYRKNCRAGLVYDVMGTQNCNYDYNVKGCSMNPTSIVANCTARDFECPLSEDCVPLSKRCDGNYDCLLEEDEQNCPMCKATHFPCVISEQCIPLGQRCNGIKECQDGTDELDCENCGAGKFLCRKSGKCISAKERCDGFAQCPDGEDEQLCKKSRILLGPRMFLCESGKHQIPQQNVCDGIVHCPDDASDEKYCQRATKAPAIEFDMQSPPPLPTQPTQPAAAEPQKLDQRKIMAFDPPPNPPIEKQQIGEEMPKQIQIPAQHSPSAVVGFPPTKQEGNERGSNLSAQRPNGSTSSNSFPQNQNQQQQQPLIGAASFPRIAFNPPSPASVSVVQNQPMNALMMAQSIISPKAKQTSANLGNLGEGNSQPPTLMIPMSNLKKMLASTGQAAKMMDSIPFQFQKTPQRQMPIPEQKPKQFVQGDFQAGVWNGTAYAQEKQNPYAEEWFSQFGQQQIEQNNLVQEDENSQWPSIPSNFAPQQNRRPQQQLNEQRRAINEENNKGPKEEETTQNSQQQPSKTQNAPTKGEMEENDQPKEEGDEGENSSGEQQQELESSTSRLGMPMPSLVEANGQIPKENPMQNPWQKKNSTGEDEAADGGTNGKMEGNEGTSAVSQEGAKEGADEQQPSEEPQNGRHQNVWTVTMPEAENANTRLKGTETESIENVEGDAQSKGGEEVSEGEEQKILKSAAERVDQIGGGSTLNEEQMRIGDKNKEEEEQREILKRLYDKFGRSAKDLLRRLENLLLLAETGIMARTVKAEDDEGSQTMAEQNQQQMRRRHVQQRREIVRQYMASVLGREIGNKKAMKALKTR